MSDKCGNCGEAITGAGVFKAGNPRFDEPTIKAVNHFQKASYSDLCQKCGKTTVDQTWALVSHERNKALQYVNANVTDFPMTTVGQLPGNSRYWIKGMVTGNVTVGTGIFSESSQNWSDMLGQTSTNSGMAKKVNSGEATARGLIVNKAISMGANCVIGVDVDYGTTANNAATVNMQGTAVRVENLAEVFDAPELERAQAIEQAYRTIASLRAWERSAGIEPYG